MTKTSSPAQPGTPDEPGLCAHGVALRPDGDTDCPICRAERAARHPRPGIMRNWLILLAASIVPVLLAIWLM